MKSLRITLLVILLSFSVVIQNYKPVSGTIIGLATTGLAGYGIYRGLRTAIYQTGYFFASIGYLFEVKCKKYIKFATSDDIVDEKYVFVNLASTDHGRFITVTRLDDDKKNGRKEIQRYEIKSHEFDNYPKKLTIGCVKYYARTLQCDLKYAYRRVLTYKDEMNRRCIQIESFKDNGNRIMKRIYRERSCAWWYDMIIDDKQSIIQSHLFNLKSSSTTFKLDLYSDILPECIMKVIFTHGYYYFINTKGGKASQITEISFSNNPVNPTKNITDLLVWHYLDPESQKTTLVVICEHITTWTCKFHKCISFENREYKIDNSFVAPLDDNTTFSDYNPTTRTPKPFPLDFDLTKKDVPEHTSKFSLHLYPDSDHYTLRPRDLNTVPLPESVNTTDAGGKSMIHHGDANNFRLVSGKRYGEIYLLSFTAIDSTTLLFNTVTMKKVEHQAYEVFYETNTRASLENMLSPYYMNLSFLGKEINSKLLSLDPTKPGMFLTAKLNDNVTFYSSLASDYKVLKNIKLGQKTVDITFDVNSQVFYCETDNQKFMVVTHANSEIHIKKKTGDDFKNAQMNNMQNLLSEVKLTNYLNLTFERKWQDLLLDLNDLHICDDIDIFMASYNTAVFKTQFGRRISLIRWKEVEIKIANGWPIVSKIMYMQWNLLLVDIVLENNVRRELYYLDSEGKNVTLLSNPLIEFSPDNLDDLLKKLFSSVHDLYPNNLPIKVFFENGKTDISTFDIDNMSIAHSNTDLFFSPGDLTAHGNDYKVLTNHKWKQVFKYEGMNNSGFYNIFTLAKKGMFYYFSSADKNEHEEFLRKPFEAISDKSIPLLIESVYLPGVKANVTNVGRRQITTYSPPVNKIFNPIIFGKHEIKLLGQITSVSVTKSINNSIWSITIDAMFQGNKKGTLTFTQVKKDSSRYKPEDNPTIEYVDESVNFLALVKNQTVQNVLDFNESKYPLDLRYMILNDKYFYFTGFTRSSSFNIIFGEQVYEIKKPSTRYNIWIRYPYDNVTTSIFLMSYRDGNKMETKSHVYDTHAGTYQIKKPEENFNWGVLSNMEAKLIHRNLLSMAAHTEDLFPVDLKLDDTIANVIMKLKIDDNTSVYTTVSNSKCVINNVRYKNAIIKGVPKQISKQVFCSKPKNQTAIVIATKTVNKMLLNAYLLEEDTFQMVSVDQLDYTTHKGLKLFQNRSNH